MNDSTLGGKARSTRACALALLALSALLTYNTVFTDLRAPAPSADATVTVPEVRIDGVAGEELALPAQGTPATASPDLLQGLLLGAEVLLAASALGALFLLFTDSGRGEPRSPRERRLMPGPLRSAPRVGEQRSRARAVPAAAPSAEGSHSCPSRSLRFAPGPLGQHWLSGYDGDLSRKIAGRTTSSKSFPRGAPLLPLAVPRSLRSLGPARATLVEWVRLRFTREKSLAVPFQIVFREGPGASARSARAERPEAKLRAGPACPPRAAAVIGIAAALLVALAVAPAIAPKTDDGLIAYGEGTVTTPRLRTWDDATQSWSPELSASAVSGTINWVVVKGAPNKDEFLLATRDASDDIIIQVNSTPLANSYLGQVCWSDGTACGSTLTLSTDATAIAIDSRSFDVAYEQQSGRAIVVYGSVGNAAPFYRTWDGFRWGPNTSVPLGWPAGGEPEWIELVDRPNTNEIALVYSNSTNDLVALIWDGDTASWGCGSGVIEANLPTADGAYRDFGASYNSSGNLLIASGVAASATLRITNKSAGSCTYATSTLTVTEISESVEVSEPFAGQSEYGIAGADPNLADTYANAWSGTGFVGADACLDAGSGAFAASQHRMAMAWVNGSRLIYVKPDAVDAEIDYCEYTFGFGWSGLLASTPATTIARELNLEVKKFPNSERLMLLLGDVNADLFTFTYSNGAWSDALSGFALEATPGLSSTTATAFDFDFRGTDSEKPRFQENGTNRTVVHKNETILLYSNWTDNAGLNNSSLWTNATTAGTFQNVTQNLTVWNLTNFSNFTLGPASLRDVVPGVKGWSAFMNDTNATPISNVLRGNVNNTTLATFQLWGWANDTVVYPQPAQTFSIDTVVTFQCRVRDKDNGTNLQGYRVLFYREPSLTTFLGENVTNATGNTTVAWNTAGLTPGAYNPTCVLEEFNSTLFYNASEENVTSVTINLVDTTPSQWASNLSANRSLVHKNESIEFRVFWSDNVALDNTSLEWNATPSGGDTNTTPINETISGIQNWSNFSRGGLSDLLNVQPGWRRWRQFANDTSGNLNNTTYQTFQLWGWANITNTTPVANVTQGTVVTLTCRVRDHHNDSAIVGYNVSFYRNTGLTVFLGSNFTNSTGVARFDWDTSGAPGGNHFPTCVLESANTTLYYNASEQDRGNTSVFVRIPPAVTSSSPTGTSATDSPLNASRTFSVTVDQAVTVDWTINGTNVFSESIGAGGTSIYTNTSLVSGTWNLTATPSNSNGTTSRAWTWTVYFPPNFTSSSPATDPSNNPGDSRSFSATVDQDVSINWTINGTSVRTASVSAGGTDFYTNLSAASGTWNVTAFINNANGSRNRLWNWTVFSTPNITQCTPGGSPCPMNHSFSTSPVATVFGVTVDQDANATWRINGTVVQTNATPGTVVNYTNTSPVAGTWNVTVLINNSNGTDNQTWLWTVFGAPAITDFQPSTPVSDAANDSRSFNVTASQTVDVNWYLNGSLLFTNSSVTAGTRAYYNNTSAQSGVWNLSAFINNSNGSAQQVWDWTVAPDLNFTSPASPVSDLQGASRTFTANANQVVTFRWFFNGIEVQTNTSVYSATYTNTSASVGTWNVTVAVNNSNGSDQFSWTWEVSAAPVLRLIREQSNGTAANRVMTVDLYLVNPSTSAANATNVTIREFINSTWSVQDCGGCAFNNSTFINWSVGNLAIDSYARVTYTVRAPSVTGFYNFVSNATFLTDGLPGSVEAETDPWNVTVQSPRAMFEFELDLNRADTDINRTLSNSSNQSATWTATNIGDTSIPDGENLTLRLEHNISTLTIADPTCALCNSCSVISLGGSERALECTVLNSSTAPGTTIRVNFTINASTTTADLVVTSNATYDPPVLPFGTYVPPPEINPGPPPASVFDYVKPTPPPPAPEEPHAPEPGAPDSGPLDGLWGWLSGLFGGGP